MGKICKYASKVDEDLYLCTKNEAYCYLDDPNEARCNDLYGSDYDDIVILDDEENIEDRID